MRPVEIRRMREADLPRVMELERICYSTPWTEPTFRGLLRRGDCDLLVACDADAVVGYAIAWTVLDQAELGNIAVSEEARGRGIGAALLERVVEVVDARGVRELFLEVRVSNERARRLYERFGFEQIGLRTNYYSAPVEDALVLRRPVGAGSRMNDERIS